MYMYMHASTYHVVMKEKLDLPDASSGRRKSHNHLLWVMTVPDRNREGGREGGGRREGGREGREGRE